MRIDYGDSALLTNMNKHVVGWTTRKRNFTLWVGWAKLRSPHRDPTNRAHLDQFFFISRD